MDAFGGRLCSGGGGVGVWGGGSGRGVFGRAGYLSTTEGVLPHHPYPSTGNSSSNFYHGSGGNSSHDTSGREVIAAADTTASVAAPNYCEGVTNASSTRMATLNTHEHNLLSTPLGLLPPPQSHSPVVSIGDRLHHPAVAGSSFLDYQPHDFTASLDPTASAAMLGTLHKQSGLYTTPATFAHLSPSIPMSDAAICSMTQQGQLALADKNRMVNATKNFSLDFGFLDNYGESSSPISKTEQFKSKFADECNKAAFGGMSNIQSEMNKTDDPLKERIDPVNSKSGISNELTTSIDRNSVNLTDDDNLTHSFVSKKNAVISSTPSYDDLDSCGVSRCVPGSLLPSNEGTSSVSANTGRSIGFVSSNTGTVPANTDSSTGSVSANTDQSIGFVSSNTGTVSANTGESISSVSANTDKSIGFVSANTDESTSSISANTDKCIGFVSANTGSVPANTDQSTGSVSANTDKSIGSVSASSHDCTDTDMSIGAELPGGGPSPKEQSLYNNVPPAAAADKDVEQRSSSAVVGDLVDKSLYETVWAQ